MQTRLQSAFQRLTFNEAGMMTRRQKAMFNKMYGDSARKVQEVKSQVAQSSSVFNLSGLDVSDLRGKWADWVSPSRFWDYFQEDEFMYVVNSSSSSSREEEKTTKERKHPSHLQLIFDEGKLFEEKVVEFYQNRFEKEEIVQVAPGKDRNEVRNGKLRKKTIQEMMKGTPIILQGVLWNEELKCYGVADMIVRNDYLPRMVEDFRPDDYFEAKAPNLKGDYHYRVIDIKNKKLRLSTKNKDEELGDALKYRYPKAQLWFYNYEVSRIQGYNPQVTYILGKKIAVGSGKNEVVFPHFNHRFGEVDYRVGKNQKYENEVRKCIQWIRDAKQYTMKKILQMSVPLPRPELYPNMRRTFHEDKLKFAQHIGELSTIYWCGKGARDKAFQQGVFSYHDEKCNPTLLGFKEQTERHRIISSELKLIRQGGNISPTKEEGLENSFFREHGENLAAFDMEFLVEHNYNTLPSVQKKVVVYMIGFAMRHMPTGLTRAMNFTAKEMTEQGEKEMVFRFIQFLNSIPVGIELLHWNHTEKTMWNHLMNKYPNLQSFMQKKFVKHRVEILSENNLSSRLEIEDNLYSEGIFEVGSRNTIIFSDMLTEFRAEPIVLKDTHGFGLKKVVNKMIELGIVKSDAWRNLNCLDGADSIAMIKQAKEMCEKMGTPLDEHPLTKEVEKYNAADCVVLLDLYEGIKNYYH